MTGATSCDDGPLPRARDFNRIVTRLRQRRTPCLPSDRAAELDERLLEAVDTMVHRHGYQSRMISQIRGLIRSGATATTSVFNDYELSGANIADVICDLFLAQWGNNQKPDHGLFKCVSLLIMAGPAAVTNRRYVGNGGATSAVLIEDLLLTGRDYFYSSAPRPIRENMRILYRQAMRLLQFIYAQQTIHGLSQSVSSDTCRFCLHIQTCSMGYRSPDDSLTDLIMSFIEADLIRHDITGTPPISAHCQCPHSTLSYHLSRLDKKIFLRIFQLGELRESILTLAVRDRASVSSFLNGMHRSAVSRRLLLCLLQIQHVPALLLQTEWFMCELVRRKDCKTLAILAPAVPDGYDKSSLSYEFHQLVHCAQGVRKILEKFSLI